MTYNDVPDSGLQPDDDAPYTRSPWAPFIAFAVTLAAGGLIIAGAYTAQSILRAIL